MAEDARVLTLRRKEQAKIDAERRAHEEAQAKAEADAAAAQAAAGAVASASRRKMRGGERMRKRRRQRPQQQQAAALAAPAAGAGGGQRRRRQRQARRTSSGKWRKPDSGRKRSSKEKRCGRGLLAQLNQVLQTRDTARGLIVSMPDVLFDFNKYTLKPEAPGAVGQDIGDRAGLSGFAGWRSMGIRIRSGAMKYNQTLSDKRAEAVRDYIGDLGRVDE